MSKISVAIADTNATQRETLAAYLNQKDDIEVIAVCQDGEELNKAIDKKHPDVVLTEIFLPGIDGIGILEKICNYPESSRPAVIMVTSLSNETIANKVMSLGAVFYMLKPVDYEILAQRIRQARQGKQNAFQQDTYSYKSYVTSQGLEVEVTKIMRHIGIPAHIKGYQFIREAIILSIKDMDIINSVTKELYPSIAKTYNTTPSRVERAIRHAIESTWNKGYVKSTDQLFGYTLSTVKGKPTNAEFIALIADRLRLQYTTNA